MRHGPHDGLYVLNAHSNSQTSTPTTNAQTNSQTGTPQNNAIHTTCVKDSKVIATIAEHKGIELRIAGNVQEKPQDNPKEKARSKAAKALEMV